MNISFIDPETGTSSVFIDGKVVSLDQLGNFLVGYGAFEVGSPILYLNSKALDYQYASDLQNSTYINKNLTSEQIRRLSEINEDEDKELYLAGYLYAHSTFLRGSQFINEKFGSSLTYLSKLLVYFRKSAIQIGNNHETERDKILSN